MDNIDNLRAQLTGPALKRTLKAKGTNKYRLAKGTGLSYQALLDWQNGRTVPKDESVIKAARFLGLIQPTGAKVLRLRQRMAALQAELARLGCDTK